MGKKIQIPFAHINGFKLYSATNVISYPSNDALYHPSQVSSFPAVPGGLGNVPVGHVHADWFSFLSQPAVVGA